MTATSTARCKGNTHRYRQLKHLLPNLVSPAPALFAALKSQTKRVICFWQKPTKNNILQMSGTGQPRLAHNQEITGSTPVSASNNMGSVAQ